MDENSVKIEPEEFIDLLKYANGDVAAILKFPQYRGKQIIIDGDLNLNGAKDIKNLNVISYVNGNLDISWSSVDYFDQEKVSGRFNYHGSFMHTIEEKKKTQKKLNELDGLRQTNAWDVTKNTKNANESEAVYDFLVDEDIPQVYEDENYNNKMKIAFDWFLGKNHLHQIIYNPKTGGCYDGLEQNHVNLNQGAESTISYLLSRLAMENIVKPITVEPLFEESFQNE
jgi:hypothetical protein